MSLFVWAMVGIAMSHFAILVSDPVLRRDIGAFLAAFGGGILTGFLLPAPRVPLENPPGIGEALWPSPARCWRWCCRTGTAPAGRPLHTPTIVVRADAHAASPRVRDIA